MQPQLAPPTEDSLDDSTNLSPALASMFAQLMMPQQYARIMADSIISCNEQCTGVVKRIDK